MVSRAFSRYSRLRALITRPSITPTAARSFASAADRSFIKHSAISATNNQRNDSTAKRMEKDCMTGVWGPRREEWSTPWFNQKRSSQASDSILRLKGVITLQDVIRSRRVLIALGASSGFRTPAD